MMPDNRTYDRSNDELQWGDRIPFEDGPSPSVAPVVYQWLLESGVPAVEARFRVYGWPHTGYTRPLVGANKRSEMLAHDGAGKDGSPEYYEFHGRQLEQADARTTAIVNEIMGR